MRNANIFSEREFQRQVLQLAHLSGWKTYHTYDSRRSTPGFPDLKSEEGRIRPEQRSWLEALAGCAEVPESYLWRPRDLQEVQKILTRGANS